MLLKKYLIPLLFLFPTIIQAEIDKASCMFGGIAAEISAMSIKNHISKQNRIKISKKILAETLLTSRESSKIYILHLQQIDLKVIDLVYSWKISDPEWAKSKFITECLNGKYPHIFFK